MFPTEVVYQIQHPAYVIEDCHSWETFHEICFFLIRQVSTGRYEVYYTYFDVVNFPLDPSQIIKDGCVLDLEAAKNKYPGFHFDETNYGF